MRCLFVLLAALLSLASQAAAPCLPIVGQVRTVTTDKGQAWAWWCTAPLPAGQTSVTWVRNVFSVLDKERKPAAFLAAAARVAVAADPLAQMNAEVTAATVVPQPGSLDEYDDKMLQYLGCLEIIKTPYPIAGNWQPLDPAICGAAPLPPAIQPPPTVLYVVSASQAFPLRADGTRSITPWPTPPISGEPCDCSVQVLQFGARFCKVPRLSTAQQTVVAGCRVK